MVGLIGGRAPVPVSNSHRGAARVSVTLSEACCNSPAFGSEDAFLKHPVLVAACLGRIGCLGHAAPQGWHRCIWVPEVCGSAREGSVRKSECWAPG